MGSAHSAQTCIDLCLMGRFVVARDGVEIAPAEFGGRKVRTLLRILATRRGRFIATDTIVDLLWPDRPPADPAANVQVLVNRARRTVGTPLLIVTGPGGYALTPAAFCVVDTEQFLAAERSCSELTGEAALAAGRAALALFHGDPLAEDRDGAWAEQYRDAVLRARQHLLERTAELALSCGDAALAVHFAVDAVAAEPLREVAALTLVRALAAAGDVAGALHQYDNYRRILSSELGLDPSPAATALQAQLLGGRNPPPAGPMFRRTAERVEPLRFVGRASELACLLDALSANTGGAEGGVFVVSGRSGAGKSRFLARLGSAVPTVSVRAFWPYRAEPWTLARAIVRGILEADIAAAQALPMSLRAALHSISPDLPPGDGVNVDPESRRALVIEAAVRLTDAMPGLVLVVDDLQWSDPTSVELLAAIADRAAAASMVLAYRPEEIEPDSVTAALLRHVRRAVDIELEGLDAADIAALVPDRPLASALFTATDRTPLAIYEVLQALRREGLVFADNDGSWRARSDTSAARAIDLGALGQRAGIARRIDRHIGLSAQTLRLLALAGRQVPVFTVAAAAGVGERAAGEALSLLSASGLARPGDQGWATAHDMVTAVVAERLPQSERRLLHGLLAGALVAAGADPAEVARHWSGAGDMARAAEAFLRAAAAALDNYADAEAEELADAGLLVEPTKTAALHQLRAQARRRRGDISGARADLQMALTAFPNGPKRATVLAELAILASGSDDLVRASELVELAIVEAGAAAVGGIQAGGLHFGETDTSDLETRVETGVGDVDEAATDDPAIDDAVIDDAAAEVVQTRAHCLEVASVIDMNLARPERSRRRAARALTMFQQCGDSRGAARILDARAMATFLDGDIRRGTQLLDRAANLFEDSGDLMRMVTPRSTRGHGMVFLDEPVCGFVDASAALDIARRLGHPEGQSYALWHRSEALSALGRTTESETDGRLALAIATSIGHRGWTSTAWRAIGIAQQTQGDLGAALESFGHSLECAEHLDLFGSWAAARSALVLVSLGRCADAEPLIARALTKGPPLAHYEARLAQVKCAAAQSDPATGAFAAGALAMAEAGGMLAHVAQLSALALK